MSPWMSFAKANELAHFADELPGQRLDLHK
jgi:hypothetical protein